MNGRTKMRYIVEGHILLRTTLVGNCWEIWSTTSWIDIIGNKISII